MRLFGIIIITAVCLGWLAQSTKAHQETVVINDYILGQELSLSAHSVKPLLAWEYSFVTKEQACDPNLDFSPYEGQTLGLGTNQEVCWQLTTKENTSYARASLAFAPDLSFDEKELTLNLQPLSGQHVVVWQVASLDCLASTSFTDNDLISFYEHVSELNFLLTDLPDEVCWRVSHGSDRYYLSWQRPLQDRAPAASKTSTAVIVLAGLIILGVTIFAFFGGSKNK